MMTGAVRLERLLGRCVLAANNRSIGRIEEFRAERQGSGWVVVAYAIGRGGLWERLGVGARLLFGIRTSGGYLARWDQVDVSNPDVPRLRCHVDELQKL
jgi:hypothetical protein